MPRRPPDESPPSPLGDSTRRSMGDDSFHLFCFHDRRSVLGVFMIIVMVGFGFSHGYCHGWF